MKSSNRIFSTWSGSIFRATIARENARLKLLSRVGPYSPWLIRSIVFNVSEIFCLRRSSCRRSLGLCRYASLPRSLLIRAVTFRSCECWERIATKWLRTSIRSIIGSGFRLLKSKCCPYIDDTIIRSDFIKTRPTVPCCNGCKCGYRVPTQSGRVCVSERRARPCPSSRPFAGRAVDLAAFFKSIALMGGRLIAELRLATARIQAGCGGLFRHSGVSYRVNCGRC